MKKSILVLLNFLLFGIFLHGQDVPKEYYQLKTYTFENNEQVVLTEMYLKNAFLPALKRVGLKNIGVFKHRPTDSVTPKNIYVLLSFGSLAQFENLESALAQDEQHASDGKDYLTAVHDRAPYSRITSTLLRAFEGMPAMRHPKLESEREDRIYELRSYEAATENLYRRKVDMFNAGGEIALFERLGFNAVFYAEVLSGAQMPNLMYMTAHENKEARDANWEAFLDSPEWKALKVMPKYQNTVSRNDTMLLYATDYSDY